MALSYEKSERACPEYLVFCRYAIPDWLIRFGQPLSAWTRFANLVHVGV
jgi:hypothetical protein